MAASSAFPVLSDDPVKRVEQILGILDEVDIRVTSAQLAAIVHTLQVGLTHPQFDSPSVQTQGTIAAVEQLIEEWAGALCEKNKGLAPLFERNRKAIAGIRRDRATATDIAATTA